MSTSPFHTRSLIHQLLPSQVLKWLKSLTFIFSYKLQTKDNNWIKHLKISKPFPGICMLLPTEYSFTSYWSLCHWILLEAKSAQNANVMTNDRRTKTECTHFIDVYCICGTAYDDILLFSSMISQSSCKLVNWGNFLVMGALMWCVWKWWHGAREDMWVWWCKLIM